MVVSILLTKLLKCLCFSPLGAPAAYSRVARLPTRKKIAGTLQHTKLLVANANCLPALAVTAA